MISKNNKVIIKSQINKNISKCCYKIGNKNNFKNTSKSNLNNFSIVNKVQNKNMINL